MSPGMPDEGAIKPACLPVCGSPHVRHGEPRKASLHSRTRCTCIRLFSVSRDEVGYLVALGEKLTVAVLNAGARTKRRLLCYRACTASISCTLCILRILQRAVILARKWGFYAELGFMIKNYTQQYSIQCIFNLAETHSGLARLLFHSSDLSVSPHILLIHNNTQWGGLFNGLLGLRSFPLCTKMFIGIV